jgi:hypothetical protein
MHSMPQDHEPDPNPGYPKLLMLRQIRNPASKNATPKKTLMPKNMANRISFH